MGFPGTWMTQSGSLIYRVVPKCACSTIGQAMHFSDHGRFYDGDIHDATEGLHKWAQEASQGPIAQAVLQGGAVRFTCVRNPYARLLSSFFDKICGIQRNGRRYRGNLVPMLAQRYGVETGSPEDGFDFDQIASFRRFVLFARDTVRWRRPMEPDIHWSSMSGHIATFVAGGGRFDAIFPTEDFEAGLSAVLGRAQTPFALDVAAMPRFNESAAHGPARAHPVEAYFDDLTRHLVYEMYKPDFELFRYDPADPARKAPLGPADLDEIHLRLAA